jgi:hypothetical protein
MKIVEREEMGGSSAADKGKAKIYLIDDHPIMVEGLAGN